MIISRNMFKSHSDTLLNMSTDELKREIISNLEVINYAIDRKNLKIKIHINSQKSDDEPRMCFILYTLSRCIKNNITLSDIDKNLLIDIFNNVYNIYKSKANDLDYIKSNPKFDTHLIFYLQLYGMRMHNNLNLNYDWLIEDLRQVNPSKIYTYPISMYVFMSAYKECATLRDNYSYSREIFNQCVKTFDFILFSDLKHNFHPFQFSELSYLDNYISEELKQKAKQVINDKFSAGYFKRNDLCPSGVAKSLEDVTRRRDAKYIAEVMHFLSSRKLSNYKEYIRPDQINLSEYMYTENINSQYVCLDTNAHLINAYLNLYEKLN